MSKTKGQEPNTSGRMDHKMELRGTVKQLKKEMSSEMMQQQSALVFAKLEELEAFKNAHTLLIYWSTATELPTQLFIEKWQKNKQFLLPKVVGNDIEVHIFGTVSELQKGALGIWEPALQQTYNGVIDVVIVPGVAFDMQKNRMGRGKGYYDRFLSTASSFKIGVCFDFQLFELIPSSSWDVKMDVVISSSHFIQ